MRNKRGNKRPRNREGTDSDQGSDADDNATGKGQTVNPSDQSVDRHNSADNLADENQRRLMELAANLANDNLRILSEAAIIHPASYSQEKPAPLKLKRTYTKLTHELKEDITKDLKSGAFSDPEIADRQGVSLSTVTRIKSKLKKLSPGERGNLRLRRNHKEYTKPTPKQREDITEDLMSGAFYDPEIAARPEVIVSTIGNIKKLPLEARGNLRENYKILTPKLKEDITKDLKSGAFPNPEIAARHRVSLRTVTTIKSKIMKLPPGLRGNLREYYKKLTPKLKEDITKDLKSGAFYDQEIAARQGVSLSTVTRIKSKLKKLSPGERGNLRLRRNYKEYTKPTPKQREGITEDLMSGAFYDPEIAARPEVSRSTVRGIKSDR
ncbi:MAG: hypothetical protein KZQ89_04420 [Candidatus Thiodiazotropha sp. (ex Lucinoma kastoroae)]|nr:hypothetical protein [Candidatus Thiodiazotropha sp. (ex Lucinoma kastoroae)]